MPDPAAAPVPDPAVGTADQLSIAAFLAARAGDSGTGLVFEGRSWTWAEVVQECRARAELLASEAVDPPHVGVLLDNVPEYVFLLGAAALSGATVVGINPTRRGDELAHDIRHTDCRLVVTDSEHAALLQGLNLGVGEDRIVCHDRPEWEERLAPYRSTAVTAPAPGSAAQWLLLFTSGSTGAPKAVRVSQGRLARLATAMPFSPDDVLYCAMPLFHGNALSGSLIPGMATGATVVLRRRFTARGFLADIRACGATYFNTVGRALSYILATPPDAADRDHRLKFVLAPETAEPDAAEFRRRFGVPVFQGYGSSEGVIRMQPVPAARPGALGRADRGADVAVVDPATLRECPPARFDEGGRLLNGHESIGEMVRRDGVGAFEGYYNNPEADAERTRNGWFWSGDLAYRDPDGIFYFAGRSGDWLRVDGENFAAAPIERILGRHEAVTGAAVYALPDPRTGDMVVAALELVPGAGFADLELGGFLAAQPDLGTKWAPRLVRVVDALPVTGTGKVDKRPLRRQAWHGAGDLWWRPGRDLEYRPFSPDAARDLESELERNGRAALLDAL